MLKDLEEIKKFIEWCKSNKVKAFKSGSLQFELSELSFVPELNEYEMEQKTEEAYDHTLVDTAEQELSTEDEDLMFWSSN